MIEDTIIKIGRGCGCITLEWLNKRMIVDQEDDMTQALVDFLSDLGFTNVETYEDY